MSTWLPQNLSPIQEGVGSNSLKHLTFGTERGGVEEALLAGEQQGQRGKGVEGCVCANVRRGQEVWVWVRVHEPERTGAGQM